MAGFFRWLADRLSGSVTPPGAATSGPVRVFSSALQSIDPIELPELGTVYVRGLLLRDRLALVQHRGEGLANVSRLLAMTIVTDKREAVFDVEGWEVYGAKHFNETLIAWQRAQDKSLLGHERQDGEADAEKKN
jgi:hypothetical protein